MTAVKKDQEERLERPECAGFHERDPVCDGGGPADEPACAYRERCLALIQLAGGKGPGQATKDYMVTIADVKRRYNERSLERWMARRASEPEVVKELAQEDSLARLAAALGEDPPKDKAKARKGKKTSKKDSERRKKREEATELTEEPEPTEEPTGKPRSRRMPGGGVRPISVRGRKPTAGIGKPEFYAHVIPIIEAVNERFARELHRVVKEEGDTTLQPGEFFTRYLKGAGGRKMALYECSERKKVAHRLIYRGEMLRRNAAFHMEVNTQNYTESIEQKPPNGVQCVQWKNVKPLVVLMNVDASVAIDTGKWLARVYSKNLIEGDKGGKKRRRKRSARTGPGDLVDRESEE